MPIPAWLMRLSDDVLVELHDDYLDHAEGLGLARTCHRLNRLLCGRSLSYDPCDGRVAADEAVVRRLAVRSQDGRSPWTVPSRYPGLRRLRWTAFGEVHGTIVAVLRAAADLPCLEDLDVCLEYCGLTDATVDGVVAQPIRAVRRAARRLRSLAVGFSDDYLGVPGVACVVAAVVSRPDGVDRDPLADLTLRFGDAAGDAVAALAPIGGMTGLRCLTVDLNGGNASSESIQCGLVDGAVRDQLERLRFTLRVDDHAAVRNLFAAVGCGRALRRLDAGLWDCEFVDRELADCVFAPLAAAAALAHLSVRTFVRPDGDAVVGSASVERLAALAPRLRSLELSGLTLAPEAVSATVARIVGGAPSLRLFHVSQSFFLPMRSIDAPLAAVVPRWPSGLGVLKLHFLSFLSTAETGYLGALLHGLRLHASAGGRLTEFELYIADVDLSIAHRKDMCATVDALPSLRVLSVGWGRISVRLAAPGIADRLRQSITQ